MGIPPNFFLFVPDSCLRIDYPLHGVPKGIHMYLTYNIGKGAFRELTRGGRMPPSRVRNTISQKGMRKIFLFFRASLFLQGMIFFMFIYQEGTFIYQEGTFISQKKLRENLGFIFYDAPSFSHLLSKNSIIVVFHFFNNLLGSERLWIEAS